MTYHHSDLETLMHVTNMHVNASMSIRRKHSFTRGSTYICVKPKL